MAVVWRKRKNLAQNVCQPAKCYYKSGLGTVNYAILHGNLFVIHSMLDVAPWRFTTLKFVGLLLARESCRERTAMPVVQIWWIVQHFVTFCYLGYVTWITEDIAEQSVEHDFFIAVAILYHFTRLTGWHLFVILYKFIASKNVTSVTSKLARNISKNVYSKQKYTFICCCCH